MTAQELAVVVMDLVERERVDLGDLIEELADEAFTRHGLTANTYYVEVTLPVKDSKQ